MRSGPSVPRSVAITSCKRVDGGWSATGTAANPGAEDASYTVTIFFTTKQATAVDFALTTVSVPAGGTVTWTASKQFAAPDGTLCVLRGVG